MAGTNEPIGFEPIFLPASRSRAWTRFLLWLAGAGLLAAITLAIYRPVIVSLSGAGSAIVALSIAVISLPVPICAAAALMFALRWLGLALWPGRVGVLAEPDRLSLRFGPFGKSRVASGELVIRYPFELDSDDADAGFEAFVPRERQIHEFLPKIEHAGAGRPIRAAILRYCVGNEGEQARALGPALAVWWEER
ncbi:MAG: hypothetical protein ACE5E5_09130 [Phycisphaerae bacterium]